MHNHEATHAQPAQCVVIRSQATYIGRQGLTYQAGISAESAGAQAICMMLLRMPPGARAKAHLHENHETAIYQLSGRSAMWYGDKLDQHLELETGDWLYIPAGMAHLPYNPGAEEAVAVIARTDPNEQESVVVREDLQVSGS